MKEKETKQQAPHKNKIQTEINARWKNENQKQTLPFRKGENSEISNFETNLGVRVES